MTEREKSKGGRPKGRTQDKIIMLRCSSDWLDAIDAWRNQQPDKPPQTTAIRILAERGIKYRGK
jgi:hypothetical protein